MDDSVNISLGGHNSTHNTVLLQDGVWLSKPLPNLISIGFHFAGHSKLHIRYEQKYVTLCFKKLAFYFYLSPHTI